MIYVRSLLAGLAAPIVIAALIIGGFFFAPFVMERLPPQAGGGMGVFVIGPFSIWQIVTAALFIFTVVSLWAFKRASKAAGPKS